MAHILIVDDEEAIAYVFSRYLEKAGHRVTAVLGPLDALAVARRAEIDALVTDLRMPGMNGGELILRLRETWPALPALIVTAYGTDVGPVDPHVRVLNKPLSPHALVEAVRDVLALALSP